MTRLDVSVFILNQGANSTRERVHMLVVFEVAGTRCSIVHNVFPGTYLQLHSSLRGAAELV